MQDSDSNDTCEPCSSAPCAAGLYRTQCTVYPLAPDADSVCTLSCSAPAGSSLAYSWTSGGSYNSATFVGKNDCAFTCNTDYHLEVNGAAPPTNNCVACNKNPATCAIGNYLDLVGCNEGSFVDSQCKVCTNKPANSVYTGYGSVDGNDCAWECDPGFYSDTTQCIACSSDDCPLGFYRSVFVSFACGFVTLFVIITGTFSFVPLHTVLSCFSLTLHHNNRDQCDIGTNLVAGTDSDCNLRCSTANADSGIGAVQTSFTWTAAAGYNYGTHRGDDDCELECNFQGGEGYYFSNKQGSGQAFNLRVCSKITARDGTCGTGTYTAAATPTTDTYCAACTNYPLSESAGAFGEVNRYDLCVFFCLCNPKLTFRKQQVQRHYQCDRVHSLPVVQCRLDQRSLRSPGLHVRV